MRKKLFTFLVALVASVGMMNAKVTWDSSNISGFYVMGSNGSYSKDGVTLSANAEYVNAQWQSSTDDISFTTNETGGFTFSNTLDKNFTKIEMTLDYLGAWYSANLGSGWSSSDGDYLMNEPSTVTWTGNASTVDLLEDEYDFDGKHVQSIVFYFEGDETDGPTTYTLRLLADPEKGSVALQNPSSDIVLNYDDTYTVPENAEVTILATPLEGYEFSGWRVGNIYEMCYYDYCGGDALSTNDNPLTVTMTADVAYVADFAAVTSDPANPIAVENGTKDGFSYTLYDNGLLEISGSGAMPNHAFVEEDFSADVKNIRFAKDCEVYSLGDMWFRCYDSKYSQLETVEINSVVPISFLGEGIFYKQESAVTITITAPGIVNVESEIVGNYYSPVNMIFNVPATTVFEKNWFLRNESYYAITIPTGATGHVPASLAFTDPDKQSQYDDALEMGNEEWFWDMFGDGLKEGVDYNKVEESTFVITAENASQIFGPATVYFQDPEPEPQPQQGIVCTAEDLDKVLCSDGSIYENVTAATAAGKTAVAMIASINTTTNKVVALALEDETGTMDWETAQSTCAAKTAVAGVAWTALSLDQIFGILVAHNGGEDGNYADLNTTIANVGGTSIPTQIGYWTKDEFNLLGICFHFDTEGMIAAGFVERENTLSVRACLEFDLTVSGGGSEPEPQTPVIHDSDDAATIETFLNTNNGTEIAELTIDRPVLNNMYNTLCLPFDMNAAQIAASSLNGVEIYELEEVTVANDELFLGLSDAVNAVVAGRPYIVKYSAASQLEDLDFENVTINNADLTAQAVTMNGVTFKGTFTPFVMGIQNGFDTNGGYLFLGQNNVLYWPNTNNPLKPFRAYFYIDLNSGSSNAPLRFGMPARIGRPAQMPTGVENVQSDKVQSTKVIENGQLFILKNGVKYNAQGQKIEN